jgi:hypothetical protein
MPTGWSAQPVGMSLAQVIDPVAARIARGIIVRRTCWRFRIALRPWPLRT